MSSSRGNLNPGPPFMWLWALHANGVNQVGPTPRPASGLTVKARWVPVRHWRGRHRLTWSFPGDEVVVAYGMVSHGELEEAEEDELTATRFSVVEAEHELLHSLGLRAEGAGHGGVLCGGRWRHTDREGGRKSGNRANMGVTGSPAGGVGAQLPRW